MSADTSEAVDADLMRAKQRAELAISGIARISRDPRPEYISQTIDDLLGAIDGIERFAAKQS